MSVDGHLVDIPMCVYNHDKFIDQAIEGVLMQQTTFKYRLLIGEDASTDNSREIIKHYLDKFPEKIQVFFHEKNLGASQNTRILLAECKAKYIALCDGDDFWTDPFKLQKQVDFLEANPDFSLCYHPVKILESNGDLIEDYIAEKYFKASESTIYDLAIFGNYIHTPSVICRKDCLITTRNFYKTPIGDYFLYLILGQKGKFCRLNFSGAIYRLNSGSYSILDYQRKKEAHQKMLMLASKDINIKLVSVILKLRVHHNSLVGKKKGELFVSSKIAGYYSFFNYVNKVELLKSIVKYIFYKPVKVD